MIDNLKAMAVFAIVVEEKSFRGAANRLSLSPSVISHHVAMLEKRIGVALIYRSTRSFSLTDEGARFYVNAKSMLVAASNGLGEFVEQGNETLTQLRIAVPEMLSSNPIFNRITDFANQNSGVQLVFASSDTASDLVKQTIDAAVRVGRLKDSELKARKIGTEELVVVASRAYLKGRKKLSHPAELETWNRIRFTEVDDDLVFKKGTSTVRPEISNVAAATDSVAVMRKLALSGLGVAGLPLEMIRADLKDGKLVRILPTWNSRTLDIFVVWHRNISVGSVTRKFINHISK